MSGGNFLIVIICANLLSIAEQGKFVYIFSSYMAVLLLNIGIFYQGAAILAPNKKSSYLSNLAKLQAVLALIFALVAVIFWRFIGPLLNWQPSIIELSLLFVYLVGQQLADFSRRSAYIFYSSTRAMLYSISLYPLRLLILLIVRPSNVSQVLIIMIITEIFSAASVVKYIGRYDSFDCWWSEVKAHISYSKFFIYCAPLGWLWIYIPVFILGYMTDKDQVAILVTIRGLTNMANVFMEQIENKSVNEWSKINFNGGSSAVEKNIKSLIAKASLIWISIFLVFIILGQEIISIALGQVYAQYWTILIYGWVAFGLYFLSRVMGIKYRIQGDNKIEYVGYFFGVLISTGLSIALIYFYGIYGAAFVYIMAPIGVIITQQLYIKNYR